MEQARLTRKKGGGSEERSIHRIDKTRAGGPMKRDDMGRPNSEQEDEGENQKPCY